jgi:hypothetical protein
MSQYQLNHFNMGNQYFINQAFMLVNKKTDKAVLVDADTTEVHWLDEVYEKMLLRDYFKRKLLTKN